MRGDQLARRWRIIRTIEASPNGLTVTEIARWEETGFRTIYRNLEALQAAVFPQPYHARPQRVPRKIFRLLLSFLNIFLPPLDSIRKTIKGFSARPPLRLCVRGLDDFMRHSFKLMHDELHATKVRISAGWVCSVGEKVWHESQKITKLPDGSLEITFQVVGLDEIKRWVLSLGPEVVVLQLEKLKEKVRKDLSESLTKYPVSHLSMKMEGLKSTFLMN